MGSFCSWKKDSGSEHQALPGRRPLFGNNLWIIEIFVTWVLRVNPALVGRVAVLGHLRI